MSRWIAVLIIGAVIAGAFEVGGIASDAPAPILWAFYVLLTCVLGLLVWNPWLRPRCIQSSRSTDPKEIL